jgi:hypothetical protein
MNKCTHYLIAIGSIYHSIMMLELQKENPVMQKAIEALREQIGVLELEYKKCI